MIQATITTIKNNSITLPKTWKGAKVLIFPGEDTWMVKKVHQPVNEGWQGYEAKLAKGRKKISHRTISEAVKLAKNHP